jgi:hypothetical protein
MELLIKFLEIIGSVFVTERKVVPIESQIVPTEGHLYSSYQCYDPDRINANRSESA